MRLRQVQGRTFGVSPLGTKLSTWLGAASLMLAASAAGAQAPSNALQSVRKDLESAQVESAKARLSKYEASHEASAALSFHKGLLRYYQGAYEEALALTDSAIANAASEEQRNTYRSARELQASTVQVTRNFETRASPDGRYIVKYSPGKDELMVPYAMHVLKAADDALDAALGVRAPTPIRLEIYPTADNLASVSALTVEQIKTTGTIALSKWNRLMITSPRALVRGYPWADTVTHEFVHKVLSQLTHERAPVWLQEGTAKLLERSWRSKSAQMRLDPSAKGLLADATRDGTLLTFDEMHPSIAMLPSQDAAALAFAEVSTFMERYMRLLGRDALIEALSGISNGQSARNALASAANKSFAELEREWRANLPKDPQKTSPKPLTMRLRDGQRAPDESLDVEEETARKFLRLGDMLWHRGRTQAAALEYGKAAKTAPDDPIVASRFARAALTAKLPKKALTAMQKMVELYPDHAPTQSMLGAAHLALGHPNDAVPHLREALFINPFDPQPHCELARASAKPHERELERQACQQLTGR